jgi:hypothetical protein
MDVAPIESFAMLCSLNKDRGWTRAVLWVATQDQDHCAIWHRGVESAS